MALGTWICEGKPTGHDVWMKAILLSRTGDPSVLEYTEVPTPKPTPGEVLVKADTIGVSRPELLVRRGVYAWMPPLPVIPGIEMAGTVAELGEGTSRFVIGQKVYVTARELPVRAGCYAEYIAVPERAPFALPPQADLEAAACLSNYQVAWHLLHTATRGAPGQSVLIGQASGGLGSAAVQLAKLAGMTAIALVGTDAKARALKAYGADHVINQSREDVAARVRKFTGGVGVDLILDAVGGTEFANFLPMLGPFGLLVSYGKLVGAIESNVVAGLDKGPAYLNSAAVRIFTMHTLDDKPAVRAESMNDLIRKLAEGAIRPLIHARLPLKDARRAHEMIEAREVIGKILLKP
jgi:NADPH2:quinone reductase